MHAGNGSDLSVCVGISLLSLSILRIGNVQFVHCINEYYSMFDTVGWESGRAFSW